MSLPVRYQHDQIEIVDVNSGEFVALKDAPLPVIASWRDAIHDWENAARDAKRAADEEVLARFDRLATWTVHEGGWTLSGPSPDAAEGVEWDADELWRDLVALPDLDTAAIDRAVESKVVRTVRAAGVKALRKLNRADVNAALDANSQTVEKVRRVSVRRAA